jgi:cell wall-associated NlpC family hydrolase
MKSFNLHLARAALLLALACAFFGSPALAADETAPAQNVGDVLGNFINRTLNQSSEVVMQAMQLLGVRYRYGGNSPEQGLDCSGLVRLVFNLASGKVLPRSAAEMSHLGEELEGKPLQPGDLVFYNTLRRAYSHVGIYIGGNRFIHAPSSGGVVRIENMDVAYWKNRFNGARRLAVDVFANSSVPIKSIAPETADAVSNAAAAE